MKIININKIKKFEKNIYIYKIYNKKIIQNRKYK